MKSFWNNYKSSIVLLGAILLGGIVGATMGEKAVVLKPIGELFLNLLFMTLVPLVFFSVTSAIANMGGGMQRLGKILKSIVIVFLGTALVAAVIGLVGVLLMNPTKGLDTSLFKDIISSANDSSATEKVGLLQQIVNTFTVNDFSLLLSRSNMLQLIVFSILFGIGTLMAGESGKSIAKFVQSGSAVMMKVINIIMMAAPTATVAAAYAISYDRESLFTSNCSLLSTVVAVVAMPILIVILEIIRNIGLFA